MTPFRYFWLCILMGCATNHSALSYNHRITHQMIAQVSLDEQDRKVMEKISPRTIDRMDHNEPLTISDVIKLSQGGVSDDAIMRYIKESKSNYQLTQTQIRRLQDMGVSQRVINYMTEMR